MFDLAARISAFDILGKFLSQYKEAKEDESLQKLNKYFLDEYHQIIEQAGLYNNWFTRNNVEFALQQWSDALTSENLSEWTRRYSADHFDNDGNKTIALILAGNIPLVGMHDIVSVLISGHRALIKPSSDDNKLIPFIVQMLVAIDKRFVNYIGLADGKLQNFDAVIATGSNNSARYFDYYFGKYPHIIRKNRSSIAVVNENDSESDLYKLGEDVFRYFGLGCRNVSKLYLPSGYDLNKLFEAFYPYKDVIDNNKYGNNYDYSRAVLMMEQISFLENGFMILRENQGLHAPASVLFYEYYDDVDELKSKISSMETELQCVVSNSNISDQVIPFGYSQKPQLWDYADKVDTLKFLRTV